MSHPFRKEVEFNEISEINVVPLADISLVLLIILMVISPMMEQAMLMLKTAAQSKDPLPPLERQMPPPDKQDLVLIVALGTDSISVGDQKFYSIGQFMGFMSAALAARTDKKVFLSPGPEVSNGKVVNMLELLKQVGAQSVALIQSADPAPEIPAIDEAHPSEVPTHTHPHG